MRKRLSRGRRRRAGNDRMKESRDIREDIILDEREMKESKTGSVAQTEIGRKEGEERCEKWGGKVGDTLSELGDL